MKNNGFLSPSQIAWRRYKKNVSGMISLVFIVLCALMAIFAYFIIPDNTPDANTQILEISTQKPGFEVDMLLVNKPTKVEKVGFFKKLWSGQPSPYRQIPFDSLKVEENTTTVYIFKVSKLLLEKLFTNEEWIQNLPITQDLAYPIENLW